MPPESSRDSAFEVRITAPGHLGIGIGRHDGRVVFVRDVLPGELVRVTPVDDRGSFVRARLLDIIEPSADRIPIACPAAARGAGCCDQAYVTAAASRRLKREVLADQLRRIAHLDVDASPPGPLLGDVERIDPQIPLEAVVETQWRTRMRFALDADGRLGLRVRESDTVVEGTDCAQPVAGLTDDLEAAVAAGLHSPPAGTEVVVGVGDGGRRSVVAVAPHRRAHDRRRGSARQHAQRRRAQSAAGHDRRLIAGEPTLVQTVGGRVFEVPADGFWQAHRGAPARYGQVVASFAEQAAADARVVWDLYGGVGVLGGAVLDTLTSVRSLTIADADARAIDIAAQTYAGDERVSTVAGPTVRATADLPAPDLVVADPPRSGAGSADVAAICAARPGAVIHVGCDPASFARDVGLYAAHGYRISALRAFDAFPLTHHVEAIALLTPS
ncbi:class I SAM-dependent RNA methyltransferase [Gordonia jinhuaensis]|uniref:RNA methyltransferase Cgl1903/cg2084 n=2 Tax=Gordonia jinhuaensis TaxID=1517702 RepID=A0A916WQS1_9ACTN|nr:putative RNA methyltransferase Cgl1903/cg2084 [Gordonia jinhuaensis]